MKTFQNLTENEEISKFDRKWRNFIPKMMKFQNLTKNEEISKFDRKWRNFKIWRYLKNLAKMMKCQNWKKIFCIYACIKMCNFFIRLLRFFKNSSNKWHNRHKNMKLSQIWWNFKFWQKMKKFQNLTENDEISKFDQKWWNFKIWRYFKIWLKWWNFKIEKKLCMQKIV